MGILDNFLDEERYNVDIQLRGFCVDFINQTLKREINIDANLADIVETHEAIQFDRGKAFYHCTKRDSLAFPGLQIYQKINLLLVSSRLERDENLTDSLGSISGATKQERSRYGK